MTSSENQNPGVMIGVVAALFIVSLLASSDWTTTPGGEEASELSPTTVASTSLASTTTDTTTEVPTTAASTTASSTTASSTTTTAPPTLDELGPDAVADALATAGFPDIEVEIDGGTVTLRGAVPDAVSQRAVLTQVGQVPGVVAIVDELTVG